jgi:hypothetical protein
MEAASEVALENSRPETVNEEAQRLITGDRNKTYDHPLDNFNRIARIWSVIFGIEVSEEQVGLAMVGVKIAREAYHPKRDNLVDGAGYFGTVQMVIDERSRREQERKSTTTHSAYCSTCKGNVEFPSIVSKSDSGRNVAKGYCPKCSSSVVRILGKE